MLFARFPWPSELSLVQLADQANAIVRVPSGPESTIFQINCSRQRRDCCWRSVCRSRMIPVEGCTKDRSMLVFDTRTLRNDFYNIFSLRGNRCRNYRSTSISIFRLEPRGTTQVFLKIYIDELLSQIC